MESVREAPLTGSVRLVWPFLEIAPKRPSVTQFVCERLGLSEPQLRDPDTRISVRLAAGLLEDAIARTGERDLGLIAAVAFDAASFGIDEYLARTRPTLRSVFEHTSRYLPLLIDGARTTFEVCGELSYSRLHLPSALVVHPAAHEFALAIGVLRSRRITADSNLAPHQVHFTHDKPDDTTRHESLFKAPLVFGAPVTQLVMSTRYLERRMPHAEPGLRELLEQKAESMLARLPQAGGYAEQVLALADCELRTISADHISGRLGVSERTLHRRLAAEGTSYRELIERARKAAALRYLEQPRSLEEVADLLGYASTQSFQRAFRRWTGTSPGSYQRRHARRTG
jgi:AraC-like DNA-binding protein